MSKHKHHKKSVYEEGNSSFGVENLGSVLGNFDFSSILNLLSNIDINKVLEIVGNFSSKANVNVNSNDGSSEMVSNLLKAFGSSMTTGVNNDNNQYNEINQGDLANDAENNLDDFRDLISKFSDYYNSNNEEMDEFIVDNNIIDPVEATTESIDMSIDDDDIINLLNAIQRLANDEEVEKIEVIKNNLQNIK